ncbi:PEP-CTERM sorting domain-containing protein [Kiritimatiellaeota bacterium B1221]|nr:PEP-CTERM sorting domain-containing protein [Kiritimatiellaeota bacterium B1221]
MKSISSPLSSLLVLVVFGCASCLSASLLITSGTQSTTIDFQSDIGFDNNGSSPADTTPTDNVFKFKGGTGNYRHLLENQSSSWNAGWSNDYGMSADAWSWSQTNIDLGMGLGNRTQFSDYNNDMDSNDLQGTIAGVTFGDITSFGITGDSSDLAYGIGDNGGNWRPFASFDLTLRVQNTSGATIDNWSFALDTWYADDDSSHANISILYSTDNITFTAIDSYTTSNNAGVYTENDLAGTFSASIDSGDYLYLQFANDVVGGSGSGAGAVIDNWTVTAIPEPSSFALMGLSLGAVLLFRRQGGFKRKMA